MSRISLGLFASIFIIMAGFVIHESFKDKMTSVAPSKIVQTSDSTAAITSIDSVAITKYRENVETPMTVDVRSLYDVPETIYRPRTRNYSYNVSGYGDTGYAWGSVDVDRDGGDGVIYDEDGNEVYISVDWTGNGTLEGYGDDGNYYELEVD